MPCSRAMFVGDAPGARLCAAIVCFCSVVQRRRRSPRGIKSTRRVGAFLRLVVGALSVDAAVSAGVAFVSIGGVNHTQPRESHVGATQRLRSLQARISISPGEMMLAPFLAGPGIFMTSSGVIKGLPICANERLTLDSHPPRLPLSEIISMVTVDSPVRRLIHCAVSHRLGA